MADELTPTPENEPNIQLPPELQEAQKKIDAVQSYVDGVEVKKIADQKAAEDKRLAQPLVEQILTMGGANEQGIKNCVKGIGGWGKFTIADDGTVEMPFGGQLRPVSEVLLQHPVVVAALSSGSGLTNERQTLLNEIAEKQKLLEEHTALSRQYPASNTYLGQAGRTRKELAVLLERKKQMDEPGPTAPVRKRSVDPQLTMRASDLKQRISALDAKTRANPQSNTYLVEATPLRRELQRVEAEIARQRGV